MPIKAYIAGGVALPEAPIIIGAGACKTPATTAEWLEVAPVVSGSYTPEQRDGNEGKVFWPETFPEFLAAGKGFNNLSMPNCGFNQAAKKLAGIVSSQPLIVSVAGFKENDYLEGIRTFNQLPNVAAIECNFGCPNTGEEIMSFDPTVLKIITSRIKGMRGLRPNLKIWYKFSIFTSSLQLKRAADVVNDSNGYVHAVVTTNTFPKAYAGTNKITPMNGLAGKSGSEIKDEALGQIIQLRQELSPKIDIIGGGGIVYGNDVIEFLGAGAAAVFMTSVPFWMGEPGQFWEHLLGEKSDRLKTFLNLED